MNTKYAEFVYYLCWYRDEKGNVKIHPYTVEMNIE